MNHYDDLPETTVYVATLPAPGPRPGPYRCGCDHSFGDACDRCDGVGDEQWQELRARRDDIRTQWRRGDLTPRQYVAATSAVSSDGLPSRDAVEALARATRDEHGKEAA